MYNKIILVGYLARDIEMRYNQVAIATTSIATNRKYSLQSGEKREEVCFVDITFFGRTAEVANQYLRKGSKVLIEGRLKFDQWQDQNGQYKSKHSVVVENMTMLGSKDQNSNNGGFTQNSYNKNSFDEQTNYTNQRNSNSYGNYNQNNYKNDYMTQENNNARDENFNSYNNDYNQNSYKNEKNEDMSDMYKNTDEDIPF